MSGQPYKKFTDVNKFRNEYLDALNIRASLDDMNLQANKNFKSTGSLPAVSQMKDSRTTSEILADTEKLKIDIVTALSKISNPQFASAVVQRIMSNPNNQDNSLLIFTAQRINDLVDKLSRIYAYGIKGDTNDVQQIVNFLTSMYSDKNAIASSTKDYLQNYTSRNIGGFTQGRSNQFTDTNRLLLSIKSYLVTLISKMAPELDRIMNADDDASVDNPYENMYHLLEQLVELLTILMDIIPSSPNVIDQIDEIFSKILDKQTRGESEQREQAFIKLLVLYKDFISSGIPNTNQISLAFKKVELYTKNINPVALEEALINLTSVLLPSEEWTINALRELSRNINYRDIENAYNDLTAVGRSDALMTPEEMSNLSGSDRSSLTGSVRSNLSQSGNQRLPGSVRQEYDDDAEEFIPRRSPVSVSQEQQRTSNVSPETIIDTINRMADDELNNVYGRIEEKLTLPEYAEDRDILNVISAILDNDERISEPRPGHFLTLDAEEKRVRLREALIQQNYRGTLSFYNGYTPDTIGMYGLGISSKGKTGGIKQQQRKRGRPKGSGLQRKYSEVVKSSTATDKGIDEDRRFIKFGKYLINNKKLNDGILAVKRPSGNNIIEFPTQHITSNFKNVIKTMIGGGMPKYEELDRLSEAEKTYLHKLASKANIIDKFSIPAPSKSQYEKDIHDFEVMKGEIMSGNDNNDLIKKFKIHILKLSKTGALPKREVMELLETLLELGY